MHRPSMFTAALFTIAKTWKQPTCPVTDEWKGMWYIYHELLLNHKQEWNNTIRIHERIHGRTQR